MMSKTLTGFTLNGITPKIAILHGLFGSSRNWRSVALKLNQLTNRMVHAIDLPNHGANERIDRQLSFKRIITSIKDTIGSEECDIIGHSMGGQLTMMMALNNMLSIRKMVIVDIAPCHYPIVSGDQIDKFLNFMEGAQIDKMFKTLEELEHGLTLIESDFQTVQFLMTSAIKRDDYYWCLNFPASSLRKSLHSIAKEWARLEGKSCDTPILFIRGIKSDYIKDVDKNIIKRVFPNSRIAELDAGHWVHYERPEEFVKVTTEFSNTQ